jgi:hypothetical protein
MTIRSNAGGGHGSRTVVDKPVRTGSGSKGTRPAGVSQIGYMVGEHTADPRPVTKANPCTTIATFSQFALATKLRSMSARAAAALVARSMVNQAAKARTARLIPATLQLRIETSSMSSVQTKGVIRSCQRSSTTPIIPPARMPCENQIQTSPQQRYGKCRQRDESRRFA